ncbi:MAG: hypothetical protein QOK47_310 [Actinomycetota bacterium]|jgi:hypothetical protein|nr:hypothetical protein [Actinomycetota bacterium]
MQWRRCVDLSVILDEEVDALPLLLRTAREAGIEPISMCGFLWGSYPLVHVLVEDEAARQIFESAGFDVRAESEVLVLSGESPMDLIARVSKLLSDAGIRMGICFLTPDGGVVVETDDFHQAQGVMDLWSQI